MGFKPVTVKQNGDEVLVGWVPEEAGSIKGATLHDVVFESQACPEPGKDVKNLIVNSHRNFDLFKLVDGKLVCRTVDELVKSEWIDWEMNWEPTEEAMKAGKEKFGGPLPPDPEKVKKYGQPPMGGGK